MGTTVRAPAARNYGQETRDTLQAQIDLAPKILAAEQKTRPGYTALDLETLDQSLNGVNGKKGLVALYEDMVPRIGAADASAASYQRGADINDVRTLGPEMQAAIKAANPEQWALIDELTRQATGDLAAGSTLTPAMRDELQSYVRGGQSARGMGLGNKDLFEEAFTLGTAGQQLLDRRRAFAGSVVDLNQRVAADPLMAILGRPSRATGDAQNFTGAGQSFAKAIGPSLFSPESQYAADINQGNYEGELAARTATANSRAGMIGGILSAGGILGGAAIKKWG